MGKMSRDIERKISFSHSCFRMENMLRMRHDLNAVVMDSCDSAVYADYQALAERMDALIESEARALIASRQVMTPAS